MTYSAHYRLLALVALVSLGTLPVASFCAAAEAASYAEVLDLSEAAALLRVKPDAVRELAETDRIPARHIGGVWRFSRAALLEWLAGGQFTGTSQASPPPGNVDQVQALAGELGILRARGVTPESSTRLAQATSEPKSQTSSPLPTVGERPATPTAEEIALRDQRVLLKRGATTVDFGISYSRSEQVLFPVIRQESSAISASAAIRYGLFNDLQVTARLPGIWRRDTAYTDATITGTTAQRVTRDDYVGDASVSLLGVAVREAVGRPNIIWSIDSVVPTGPGDRGLGGGLVLSKSYDPAVIFAGLSYLHGFSVEPTDARRSLAKHNFGLSMGYTYALNDALALNTVFVGTYRNTQSPDGVTIPPPRERHQLQFGMTWMLARGLFIEPAVAMRLGGASPDLTLSLNVPYSF